MGFFSIIKSALERKKNPVQAVKEAVQAEKEAKEKAEREYAAKQASVDTEIVESSNGKLSKNSLKIRKGRSSGSGRNLV